jgi:enamine deaminase RidA (YjgF/YER057c/UK114 family)
MTIKRSGSGPINSAIVEHNGVVYLSGFTADDLAAGMEGQTRQVLAKIDTRLAEAGTDKTRLLSAVVYLADMTRKEEMNTAWKAWIGPRDTPARACVGTPLAAPEILVEIMVTAAK